MFHKFSVRFGTEKIHLAIPFIVPEHLLSSSEENQRYRSEFASNAMRVDYMFMSKTVLQENDKTNRLPPVQQKSKQNLLKSNGYMLN